MKVPMLTNLLVSNSSQRKKLDHRCSILLCINTSNRYNPYTEPSMELFSYHKGLKKLVEVRIAKEYRATYTAILTKHFKRLATVACSDRRCWRPWDCPRT